MLHRRHLAGGDRPPRLSRHGAQAWAPTRPIQCIIGFAPGGGADLIARAIIEAAQPLFPQPLVVVNKPGAGGTIAAQQVAGMPGDGHVLLMGGGSARAPASPPSATLPYDARRWLPRGDSADAAADVHPGQGGRPVPERCRRRWPPRGVKPQAVSHGSSGNGSIYHAAFVVLEKRAGVELLHVPFTGGAPGLQAVAAGQVDLMVASPEEFQRPDRWRAAAGAGLLLGRACGRLSRGADAAGTRLGHGAVENMKGWVVPANTPDAAVTYLHDRFRAAMARPSWQAFVERAGETDGYLDGPAFQAAMAAVLDAIGGAVKA